LATGHVGDVSFTKLLSGDLAGTIAAVPQALDNQWLDRELLGASLAKGGMSKRVAREHADRARREYLRSLLNAEKIIVNRAYFYNSHAVYSDYLDEGPDERAFRELLADAVIVPLLLQETSPLPEDDVAFDVGAGFAAWRRIAESTEISCLRLSWDDHENDHLARAAYRGYAEFLTGFNHFEASALRRDFDLDQDEAASALVRLKEIARWAFEETAEGRPVTRQGVYEQFVTRPGINVAERQYDPSKPHVATVKQLVDLKYNTNLADAFDVFTLTPSDTARRTALQEGLALARRRRDAAPPQTTDADELIRALRTLAFEEVQGLLEAVPTLDRLTLSDIRDVRAEREWRAYRNALAGLLERPSVQALTDPEIGVVAISRAYLEMMNKAEEIHALNWAQGGGRRFEALTEIAIDIGSFTINVMYLNGHSLGFQVAGELGALAGSRVARVTLRLGLGRFLAGRARHRIETTAQLLDLRMDDPYREAGKLIAYLTREAADTAPGVTGSDLSSEGE
jgi:hypothetical protein